MAALPASARAMAGQPQLQRRRKRAALHAISTLHRPAVVVVAAVSRIGWTNAPLVATSHAAKRTHFLPAALNGIVNFFLPNGARSVAGMIWRSVLVPSPHTTSTKLSG